MGKNLFSVPIFFIVFRETLEAAIIVSVLLGLAEQIVHDDPGQSASSTLRTQVSEKASSEDAVDSVDGKVQRRRLLRKLRFQVQPSLIRILLTASNESMSNCFTDFPWCRTWSFHRPCHRRCVSRVIGRFGKGI